MRYIKIIILLLISNSLFGQGNTGNVLSGGVKSNAVFYTDAYGIRPDGTDQTSKIQALLDTVYNRGGGHIVFSPGTYRINGRLKPKTNYNGSNVPQTPDMVISGSAGFQSGNGQKPTAGTIFDMRYEGDTIGCIQFRGTGKIEIEKITFQKVITGLPNTFIHTTLTTLHIHDCGFVGFSTTSRNKGIVLGGNFATPALPDTSVEAGFQGYGTVIESNYFNWISTGVMFQTYANAVIVSNNNFWNGCGGFAAIWFACKNDTNTGNVIENNLIEMNTYTYGIYLGKGSVSNTIKSNNFYDGPIGSKNIGSVATNANMIIEGFNGAGIPYHGNNDVNTKISMQSGDTTYFASNILLRSGNYLGLRGGLGERIYRNTGDEYGQTSYGDIGGVKNMIWRWNLGATSHELIQIQDYQPTKRFTIRADAANEFGEVVSSGNMRIYGKSGGELYMGLSGNINHLFLGGTLYGGLTSTTTTFKSGQGDRILWGDTNNPLSGDGAGFTSSAINVMRTINAAGTDGRHQASEFYATGTGANQIPVGNTAARPTGQRGYIRNNLQTGKFEGVRVGTSYERFFMLEDTLGATNGQVLTYNSGAWAPATNTSESTSIGAFQSSGNSNGLTLSGTDIRLHAATISTPGAVNVGQQTFGVSSGTKLFNGTGSYQIDVDGDTDNTPAGITFTQLGGADQLGFMYMNSADANNASFRLGLEEGGGLTDQLNIGTLNDTRGMYSRNGLYEDVTAVTTSPYTVLYGDRNIYLDGTSITVNLQAIGGSTGETKVGRVIYFFNDNATNVTITPNGSETINDSASLTLLPNTGVTLLAVTGTKWVTRD